jgi:hypothetical protein
MIYNTFTTDIGQAFLTVLRTYLTSNAITPTINLVLGQISDHVKLPQIAVAPGEADEEIFQTGIYRVKVAVIARTDLDIGTTSDMRRVFAAITDCFQQDSLVAQLNLTGLAHVDLVIPGSQSLVELGNRYIEKTTNYEVLGFSVPTAS